MKAKGKKILRLGLLLVGLFSLCMVLRQQFFSMAGQQTYAQARELAGMPREAEPLPAQPLPEESEKRWVPVPADDEYVRLLKQTNLAALQEVNPDVLGWILIPDSQIDYPIVQGADNQFYLRHTWDGERNGVGSVFLECANQPDMTEFHTIVYGHNMKDGSMFASLRKYAEEQYWRDHPYIYIANSEGVCRYEVFSAYRARVDSYTYGLGFERQQDKESFIQMLLQNSQIDTGIQPEATDRILTLSTCSGMGYTTRWVVNARLKMVELE